MSGVRAHHGAGTLLGEHSLAAGDVPHMQHAAAGGCRHEGVGRVVGDGAQRVARLQRDQHLRAASLGRLQGVWTQAARLQDEAPSHDRQVVPSKQ